MVGRELTTQHKCSLPAVHNEGVSFPLDFLSEMTVRHYALSVAHGMPPSRVGLWPNFHCRSDHGEELRPTRSIKCHARQSSRNAVIEGRQFCRIDFAR